MLEKIPFEVQKVWAYRLVTNDPSKFLSISQLQQNWRKL